ncbi:aminodeoxychorismate/anthranilate synthase component II [Flavobacterium sp.]|uniref:anthranilate synthase component II n=1 Tax=Flavobacterium sp. TaxID=239 RepID=UPI00262423FB|nr:aminodeoxychorismate/anthranilate synthase component II [Flavobacterium sp.]
MKVLVVDNYDSFVYNIVHLLYEIGVAEIDVIKNDQLDFSYIHQYDKIVLSPGPGIPKNAGMMPQLLAEFSSTKSILGICLGHQAIAEHFGADLINLSEPLHGVTSQIEILKEDYFFENLPKHFKIGHYHSWVVSEAISDDLEVLAKDELGNIMAIKHKKYDVRGLQFHPESILTENGKTILTNWINSSLNK